MGTNFAVLGIGMAVAGPLVDAVGRALGLGDRRRHRPRRVALTGYAMLRREPRGGRPSLCRRDANHARDWTRETLAAGVRAGDRRALARAITLVESSDPLAHDLVHDLYPETGTPTRSGSPARPGSASRA